MTTCCVRCHCVPDYGQELKELLERAKETQEYLKQLEDQISDLETKLQNDLQKLNGCNTNNNNNTAMDNAPWMNKMASVVMKTGASLVTHQPALTPWGSIFRLFQKRPAQTT